MNEINNYLLLKICSFLTINDIINLTTVNRYKNQLLNEDALYKLMLDTILIECKEDIGDYKIFGQFAALRLAGYNSLRKLTFREIFYLVFDLNQLKKIDKLKQKTIVEIWNLQILELNDNGIEEIPREISSLVNLEILQLNDNQIEEIPQEISFLTNLQQLRLDDNKIKVIFPEIAFLTNLQIVSFTNNQIKEIPQEISSLINLVELRLSSNQIKEIPLQITSLTNLQKIYLSNNKIKKIPSEIASLNNLRYLYVSMNKIKEKEIPLEIFNSPYLLTFF